MLLSTRRYQVASITQNNHVYEDLVEYFRLEELLNLRSQVNVRNASTTSRIAYLLIANLRDPTKPKTLPTFDVRYPVDSTPTMALTYPKKYEKDINPEIWNTDIIDFVNAKQ